MGAGAALLLSSWWSMAWGCDAELLAVTKGDLASAKNDDYKIRRLAGSLAESCDFVPTLASVLGTVPSTEIPNRPKLEQKVVTSEAAAWSSACPGGAVTFQTAFAQAGDERAKTLYAGCDLGRLAFATEAELGKANGFVFLAILVGKHLQEQKVPETVAQPLVRALAGISGAAPPMTPVASAPAAAAPAADPWAAARERVAGVAGKPATAFPAADWSQRATALLQSCEALRARPAVERIANRALEFDTCAEAGRAADHTGTQVAPLFRPAGATTANWGYALAASVARTDPNLITAHRDETIRSRVGWYLQQLSSGAMPPP
jgi:hypothetical protein